MIERPVDGHAGDLLSAHLDGELDDETATWVSAHLQQCLDCRVAADDLATASSWLQALPTVDATAVVEDLLARHRALIRTGAAFIGAACLVLAALALTSTVANPSVVPAVDDMAHAHVNREPQRFGDLEQTDDVDGAYAAPPAMIGNSATLNRRSVFDGRDLSAVLYGGAGMAVSVFQQPGRLDWSGLPDGDIDRLADRRVWIRRGSPMILVTEVGHLVVTVVSEDREAALTVAGGLPAWHRTALWDRLHDACQRVIEVFALSG